MKKIKPMITLGLLAMFLTIGICVQLKTINAADMGNSLKLTDTNLKKSLLQWKSKYESSNNKLKSTSDEMEQLRADISKLNYDEDLQQKIRDYEIILGMTDVSGQGITVVVADNNNVNLSGTFASINSESYMVHDGNLIEIINELKAAGAEAISINGKRIVNSTCITCAGNVIQINGEKVGSPFEIKAIGDKDLLYGALNSKEGVLYRLKKCGVITSIKKSDKLNIEKNI